LRAEREDAFVTQGIVMNSSNLALRLEPEEEQPAPSLPPATARSIDPATRPPRQGASRPRTSFTFRAIVIRDQELKLSRFY